MGWAQPTEIAIRTRCVHCGADRHGQPYAMHPGGTLRVDCALGGAVLLATTIATTFGADIELIDEAR